MVFCRNEHDWVLFCAPKGVFFLTRKGYACFALSKVKGQESRVESQVSRVESQENGWCVSTEKREEKREIGKKRHVF